MLRVRQWPILMNYFNNISYEKKTPFSKIKREFICIIFSSGLPITKFDVYRYPVVTCLVCSQILGTK